MRFPRNQIQKVNQKPNLSIEKEKRFAKSFPKICKHIENTLGEKRLNEAFVVTEGTRIIV